MRVLILSCVLACVAAAPSIAPVIRSEVVAPVAAVPLVAPVPVAKLATVDPGDIEAEAINAKVAAEDAAIAAADKARLLGELVVEDAKDKTQVVADQVKEKNEEAFWSVEDQKWRYLDAVNTAEAKLDGAIAKDATILARSSLGGLIVPSAPLVAPGLPLVAPILAPRAPLVAPIVYSAAPILKTGEKEEKMDQKMGEKMDETMGEKMDEKMGEKIVKNIGEKWETIIKSAEMINEELKIKMAELEKHLEAKPAIFAPTLFSAPIAAPYKLTEPWLTQVYVPGAAYNAAHLPSLLHPSVKVA